jgi:hypothetical protein
MTWPQGEYVRLTLLQPVIVTISNERSRYARALEGHCIGLQDGRLVIEVFYAVPVGEPNDERDVCWWGPLTSHIMSIAESAIASWHVADDPRLEKPK